MLTLSDINTATSSKDGDIFSDLHRGVYGFRPRYARFASVKDFDAKYEHLVGLLTEQNACEAIEQQENFAGFVIRVEETMQIVQNCTRERAIQIIADAHGIDAEGFNFYGLESLEYKFGLKFGSIAQWLSE